MVSTAGGQGYLLAGSNGRVFNFDTPNRGSANNMTLNGSIVGMAGA